MRKKYILGILTVLIPLIAMGAYYGQHLGPQDTPTFNGATLTGDLDMNGNYLTQSQSVADLASKGRSYWFSPNSNDRVYVGETYTDGMVAVSIIAIAKTSPNPTSGATNRNLAGESGFYMYTNESGGFRVRAVDAGGVETTIGTFLTTDNAQHVWTSTIDTTDNGGDGYTRIYKDGNLIITDNDPLATIVSTGNFQVGGDGGGRSWSGEISKVQLFNLALSADEVKALSSGGEVPYKYVGASQTAKSSSTLVNHVSHTYETFDGASATGFHAVNTTGFGIVSTADEIVYEAGKKYRITFTVAGVSGTPGIWQPSTLIGGGALPGAVQQTIIAGDISYEFVSEISETGAVFWQTNNEVAAEYTISNFKITQIGCVLDLNPSGISPSQWVDASPNHLNGTVNGAKVVNKPAPVIRGSQVNLLTNSGFGVWSQSDGLYTTAGSSPLIGDGTDLIINGEDWTGATGVIRPNNWTGGDWTGNGGTNSFTITGSGQSGNGCTFGSDNHRIFIQQNTTVDIGKLYEYSFYTKNGSGNVYRTSVGSTNLGDEYYFRDDTSDTDWVHHTGVIEATTALFSLLFVAGNGTTIQVDSVQLHEVTPGITSGTAGPNGWGKDSTLSLFRQHNDSGTLTKDGSFYALKTVSGNTNDYMYWPLGAIVNTGAVFYQKFAGRTVTYGAWVKTSVPSHVFLQLRDSDTTFLNQSSDSSPYHTGGGDWEWLEVTATISSTTTLFTPYFIFAVNGATAYISQPMLVFGDSIGTGNYVQPPGEWVNLENPIATMFSSFNNVTMDTDATINLESETSGMLPKGAVSVHIQMEGVGSQANAFCEIESTDIGGVGLRIYSDGTTRSSAYGVVPCGSSGDIRWDDRTGDFTSVYLWATAVQVSP